MLELRVGVFRVEGLYQTDWLSESQPHERAPKTSCPRLCLPLRLLSMLGNFVVSSLLVRHRLDIVHLQAKCVWTSSCIVMVLISIYEIKRELRNN